jgi:FlaG/FlaF family flagellin (archaellin)
MNSKGVTPVIATVLLITISVAATGAAYTYIINAQDAAANDFQERLTDQQIRESSDLGIEHIYSSGGGFAFLVVRNTGTVDQIVQGENDQKYWTLYVDGVPVGTTGSSGTGWEYLGTTPTGSYNLEPSKTLSINSTEPFPSSGEKAFKIVGRYGSTDTYICFGGASNSC